ncbi:class IV adenylate cyclase [Bacteroidota bacterium]
MAQNLELKIKIDQAENIVSLLEKNGAIDKGILNQKDTYYYFDKGILKLRLVNGRFELIKYLRDEVGDRRWSNYELLKLEAEDVEGYLNDLFEADVIVEKLRRLYIYKNTRVHLDEVKHLGYYLELETVVNSNQSEAKKEFDEIVELLKLDRKKEIRSSYRDLIKNR